MNTLNKGFQSGEFLFSSAIRQEQRRFKFKGILFFV